jgi:hypothetical protein
MRFSIAFDEDATILTSSSGGAGSVDRAYSDLPEQSEFVRTTGTRIARPRLHPVLREQPSPVRSADTQLTEK